MDTNKKIIVVIVGVILLGVLVFTMKGLVFSGTSSTGEMAEGLEFDSPDLDIKKFDNSTKKELYDETNTYDEERYDSLADNLSFLQKMKDKLSKKDIKEEEMPDTNEEEMLGTDENLQMLMELQNNLNKANPQYDTGYVPPQVVVPEPEKKKIPQEGDYFFGASSTSNTDLRENLIPAEVIDQGVLRQGSTIALRTKQPIVLTKSNIKIPKGAVIYGVVNIEDNRLNININKYKRDNKLFSIDMNVYDYDGLQGIHLNHGSIFSIPSNVSKDVYKAALQTYRQQSIIGNNNAGNNREPLGRIAALSAAKEISRELFDKRKVFVPRKYHIWLTINNQDNDK
ncbi:Protein of unknown function [Zobellia uliginosa]|uniref:Conjugative transposon TraM C-terminal domain-containing protein n=1 Tax=Zobellia uliginosa TaxID=143224 RepID=A0ABY1L281_9FLAO|nr:conjugative transposon protein TraM [Zobellia uliginosa]SIT15734.1 Protein of unknown function [Zobellia uliginosa]